MIFLTKQKTLSWNASLAYQAECTDFSFSFLFLIPNPYHHNRSAQIIHYFASWPSRDYMVQREDHIHSHALCIGIKSEDAHTQKHAHRHYSRVWRSLWENYTSFHCQLPFHIYKSLQGLEPLYPTKWKSQTVCGEQNIKDRMILPTWLHHQAAETKYLDSPIFGFILGK